MSTANDRAHAARLAFRFAIIISIALLPAGIIAFIQTSALEREVQARSEAALMGATFRGASAETAVIGRVRGMAASLAAALPDVLDDPARCDALLQRVAAEQPSASIVAYVPPSGFMTCNSVNRDFDYSGDPMLPRLLAARAPTFFVNPRGPVSGQSVLGIIHPVFEKQGTYAGYVAIVLPHAVLAELRLLSISTSSRMIDSDSESIVFWTFDGDGTVLSSNVGLANVGQNLPKDQPLAEFVGGEAKVFQATSAGGKDLTFAIVPIVNEELYIMSSFQPTTAAAALYGASLGPYMPTFLMWLAGLVGAGFAAEVLVTRHVRTLNLAMGSFARGDRRLQALSLQNAPAELDELAQAYVSMTDSITRSEAELEDSVHQKEVLLREVHHRVKNNLQLISSIMNIQIRNAKGGEAKEIVKNLQERIMSLATVHRGLYQTSGLADVKARELIPDIVRQIMSLSSNPDRPFETNVDIDDLRLVPDQAVPLSLLLSEAMTNAMKHAGATRGQPGRLTVRLKRSGSSDAMLEVTNSRTALTIPPTVPDANTGLGTQLIVAFVQQLAGQQETLVTDTSYALKVTFHLSPLTHAEQRQVSHLNLADADAGNA